MKIKNRYNYPDSIIRAVKKSLHRPEPNMYGVTSLVGPPLIRHLRITEWDKIVVDVDDFLDSLFGSAWHSFLEKYSSESLAEHTWTYNTSGIMVRGKTDTYREGGIIDDHKTVKAFSFIFGIKDWEQQLNLYALLARKNGYPVNQLNINAFIKDWSEWEFRRHRKDGYPEHKFYKINVPLWSLEKQEQYLQERLRDHLFDSEPRECTPEEKWAKPDMWAVKKKGRKSALRVLPTEKKAQEWLNSKKKKDDLFIEYRFGECTRCDRFCFVRGVCPYAK